MAPSTSTRSRAPPAASVRTASSTCEEGFGHEVGRRAIPPDRCARRERAMQSSPPPRTPFRTPPPFRTSSPTPAPTLRGAMRPTPRGFPPPRATRTAPLAEVGAIPSPLRKHECVCVPGSPFSHSPLPHPLLRLIPLSFAAKVPGAIDDRYVIFPTFTTGTAEILPGQVFDVYVEVHGAAPTSFPKVEVKFQGANAWVPVGALTPSTGVAVRNATKAWTVSESLPGRRAGARAQKSRTRPNSPLPPPPLHTGLHMTHGTSLPPLHPPLPPFPPQPTSIPTSPASTQPPAMPWRPAPSPRTATGTTASPSTTSALTTSA
jgi:hypothetical protein